MNSSNTSTDASVAGTVGPVATPNSTKDVFGEILEWSKGRPNWQCDALRRLLTAGGISDADVGDLVDLCKSAHGLTEPRVASPLKEEHLAIKGTETAAVSILSVTHHCGVNALAAEQTVAFGQNLTGTVPQCIFATKRTLPFGPTASIFLTSSRASAVRSARSWKENKNSLVKRFPTCPTCRRGPVLGH
jgi:hypothetical protein